MTHFINTVVKELICRKCLQSILEAHVNGWLVKVDHNVLTIEQEIAARQESRKIYSAFGVSSRDFELIERDAWRITHYPHERAFQEHRCNEVTSNFARVIEPVYLRGTK